MLMVTHQTHILPISNSDRLIVMVNWGHTVTPILRNTMFKFILTALLLIPTILHAELNTPLCGKYAIQEDEVRITITQLTDKALLYAKMMEVQVIKMDILTSLAEQDTSIGENKNNDVIKEAAEDIINETQRITTIYNSTIFEIEIQAGNKAIINETYIEECGDYIVNRGDLNVACATFPELSKTINCKVLRNVNNVIIL